MSATLFFSVPHTSNTFNFPHKSNSISDFYIPVSLSLDPYSLRNPKPIYSSNSKPLKITTTNPSISIPTTSNGDNDNKPTSPDHSFSSEHSLHSTSVVNMRTAPWMKGPLLLEPNKVLDLSKQPWKKKTSTNGKYKHPDWSLTQKESGGRGKNAMKKIFESIGKLEETQKVEETQKNPEKIKLDFSLGEFEGDEDLNFGGKMPWEREERMVFPRIKKEKLVTSAELILDGMLLERLRSEAARIRKWVKVKKAGVTQDVVDQIHLIWKNNELAMLKFDLPLCRNMERAREIVEIKTGGLVVWSKKDVLVIYKGCNHQLGLKSFSKAHHGVAGGLETFSSIVSQQGNATVSQVKSNENTIDEIMSRKDGEEENLPINRSLYERETDRLLDSLGPRFVDWWWPKPLPVDADLLPEVVPGFKPPFRLCPPRARSKLTDDELTYLRKLTQPLPTHFVLGRNRNLQGLAAAILKLWEKCHIAKIAVKLGVPNTNNELMANELKCLTGGVLLLRNKFFIILYRGKDFLPPSVSNLVEEREMELKSCQLQEEAARQNASETVYVMDEPSLKSTTIGTLSEFQDILSEFGELKKRNRDIEVQLEAEKERLEKELRNQERKLFILKKKIERSAKELAKLNSAWRPAAQVEDQEMITQEERECFRKIGLKMGSSLVLGRRGVFDGVMEGLHQHWKHREVVKVITMQRKFLQVIFTAKLLEAESGGMLVSVEKLKEGHAIIIYRGKNYRRPLKLVPRNLLTKREALFRSLEVQRIGSLKFFAYQRQRAISELKCELAELQKRRGL